MLLSLLTAVALAACPEPLPPNATAWEAILAGQRLEARAEWRCALARYRAAARRGTDAERSVAHNSRGLVLEGMGRISASRRAYRRAVAAGEASDPQLHNAALANLGLLLADNGRGGLPELEAAATVGCAAGLEGCVADLLTWYTVAQEQHDRVAAKTALDVLSARGPLPPSLGAAQVRLGFPEELGGPGILVIEATPESPLQPGDIVVRYAGVAVGENFSSLIAAAEASTEPIPVVLLRAGRAETVRVSPGALGIAFTVVP